MSHPPTSPRSAKTRTRGVPGKADIGGVVTQGWSLQRNAEYQYATALAELEVREQRINVLTEHIAAMGNNGR